LFNCSAFVAFEFNLKVGTARVGVIPEAHFYPIHFAVVVSKIEGVIVTIKIVAFVGENAILIDIKGAVTAAHGFENERELGLMKDKFSVDPIKQFYFVQIGKAYRSKTIYLTQKIFQGKQKYEICANFHAHFNLREAE
jgi:hypothetical protein